ncbi:MAG: hypothetical protein K6E69_02695 [Treponema sp.]|uniref:hypothetical protein n=1 Tax=Treponema sp. TaxID=166 RepID=UPI00298DCB68|nr:hypothetical protein [Treponema sp.]MCR5386005.1 hypothetical protein [Treponema sp.]
MKKVFLLLIPTLFLTSCMYFRNPLVPVSEALIDEELTGLWCSSDNPDKPEFQISNAGNNQYLFNELDDNPKLSEIKSNDKDFTRAYSVQFDGNKYLMITNNKADTYLTVKYEINDENVYFTGLNESFFENAVIENKLSGNVSTEKILGVDSKHIEITSKTNELQKFFKENKDSLFNTDEKTTYKKFADYIQKFSKSDTWHSDSPDVTCKLISEIKIYSISRDKKTIQAEIFHVMTPFSPVICTKVELKLKGDKYVFAFTDPWHNKAFGWFKYTDDGAQFFIDCKKFDKNGKNCARLYGTEPSTLCDTTVDKDFVKREIGGEDIAKKILNNFDKRLFPADNKDFCVHYIGTINDIDIYKTELIWGSARRCTHRLVFVKNLKPFGEYSGIVSDKIRIKNKTIVFDDIDGSIGNVIDMTNSIPQKIYIDGEQKEFWKY